MTRKNREQGASWPKAVDSTDQNVVINAGFALEFLEKCHYHKVSLYKSRDFLWIVPLAESGSFQWLGWVHVFCGNLAIQSGVQNDSIWPCLDCTCCPTSILFCCLCHEWYSLLQKIDVRSIHFCCSKNPRCLCLTPISQFSWVKSQFRICQSLYHI
jgi:hypothetical protein